MRPKEKAQELVDKYEFIEIANYTSMVEVKECALIAVEETLCVLSDLCCDFVGNDIIEKEIAYWKQVKQELNKS